MRWLALLMAVLSLMATPAMAATPPESLAIDTLAAWSVKASPTDQFYLEGGKWIQPTAPYLAKTQGGPLTASALLWNRTRQWFYYTMAAQTAGWMFNNGQRADGAFADPADAGAAIPTEMFLQEVGQAYLLLSAEPHFLPEQGAWWRQRITKAADFLINHGDSTWYANGNVNVGYMASFYFAARITGEQRFKDAYERQFWFAQFPTTNQFKSYGLFVPNQPTVPECANGTAYFTEASATSGPGYDTEYTGVQLDELVRLYSFSGEPRIKCLTNLLLGQIQPRINTGTWMLDTSGGTRHPEAVRTVPFISPSIAILEQNGRADLAGLGAAQFPAIDNVYRQPGGWIENPNVNSYISLAGVVAPMIDELTRSGAVARVPLGS